MSLRYVKGSYMDEILVNGNPVLVVLEGLEEGKEKEARPAWNGLIPFI